MPKGGRTRKGRKPDLRRKAKLDPFGIHRPSKRDKDIMDAVDAAHGRQHTDKSN